MSQDYFTPSQLVERLSNVEAAGLRSRSFIGRYQRGRLQRPDEVRDAWSNLMALEATGFATNPKNGRYLGPVRLTADGVLLSTVSHLRGPMLVQLEGYAVIYRFLWDPRSKALPLELSCEALRKRRRARVSPRVKLDVSLPGLGEAREFTLRDVSHAGVGFDCDEATLISGQELAEVTVRWKGGEVLQGSARIAHFSRNPVTGAARCGLVLHFSPATRARWRALVDCVLFPNTREREVEPRALWNSYVESGYLRLSGGSPDDFSSELHTFERAHVLLRDAPEVGAYFAAGDSNRFEAFVHQVQVWKESWLIYQLSRLPSGRSLATSDDHVLVDLFSRAYHYMREHGAKWATAYIQKDAGYSRAIHYESARQLEASGLSCVLPFHAVEVMSPEPITGSDFDIVSASVAQAETVRAFLATRYPMLYLEATGLAEEGLRLDGVCELWEAHALERRRQVLVAVSAGHVVASAVLDAASPGLHVYGLLDCARVFAHTSAAEPFVAALLAAARSWYGELGRSRFTYFRDDEHDPLAHRPGCRSLGEAYYSVHSADAFPELLERISMLAARNSPLAGRRNVEGR